VTLNIKSAKDTKFDIVSLGEVMLRLDPGEGRIKTATNFRAWEGGGEYNVARGLRKCFGLRAGLITGLVDNEVGHLIENLIDAGGVSTEYIHWAEDDGIGRSVRNGLNFTERGFGIRGAVGVSDRGLSAASQLQEKDFDLDKLFNEEGVRWLHTGGIYAALSEQSMEFIELVMKKAKESGTIISYDLNYRPSLWKSLGGQAKAQEVNRRLAKLVDVMIGNEEDFTASLGIEIENVDENLTTLPVDSFKKMINKVSTEFPNFEIIATTLRSVKTATVNDWNAIAWSRAESSTGAGTGASEGFAEAIQRPGLEILDRVGGGDSFASGLIYGLLEFGDINTAVNYGAAHGALAMTTPGDTTMASKKEVEKLVAGGGARVAR
jgi:2-dehydro-3-deoxygluconokinase